MTGKPHESNLMQASFPELIGRVIHNCGALELLINNTIRALSKDPILFNEVITMNIPKRIKVLRELLTRANLLTPEINALITEIPKIAEDRNLIAHNPIASDDKEGSTSYVMVVRHKSFPPKIEKIDRERLEAIAKQSNEALVRFARLIPGSVGFEPHSA